MHPIRTTLSLLVLITTSLTQTFADAAVHFWEIKEVFSNADGSVQFIELIDDTGGEHFTQGTALQTNSDGVMKTFTFPDNIPLEKDTLNGHLLIATPGFGALAGGVAPDFRLDQSSTPLTLPLFNPNATSITITFSGSVDSISFSGASLPKDGINSLTDMNVFTFPTNLVSGVNSPTNIDDQEGEINLSTPAPTGDYNGDHFVNAADYVVWRDTLTQTVPIGSGADGNKSGTIDDGDYTFWRERFGNAVPAAGANLGSLAVPEPIAPAMMIMGLCLLALRRRR